MLLPVFLECEAQSGVSWHEIFRQSPKRGGRFALTEQRWAIALRAAQCSDT